MTIDRRDFLTATLAAGVAMGADPGVGRGFSRAGAVKAAPGVPQQAATLFRGFEARKIATSGATINVLRGGSGPPLLLAQLLPFLEG